MSTEKKSKYFSMSEDVEEIRYGWEDKKLKATGMLLLKSVANLGIFTATEVIPNLPKALAKEILKNPNATEEKKEKAREIINK